MTEEMNVRSEWLEERDSPGFCAPWSLEKIYYRQFILCNSASNNDRNIQTFTSALQACTVDMVLIKQPAVESWNQMPQWDEKALTGRNVDDLVLSYLVWSHLALPYAHGMKNKQERRENSQKPGTVSAAAAGADAVCSALLCSVATCLRIFIRAIIVVAIFVT
ncbi:putative Xaa-Pro aminopeptidase pepP [Trichinella pseudospiralis]